MRQCIAVMGMICIFLCSGCSIRNVRTIDLTPVTLPKTIVTDIHHNIDNSKIRIIEPVISKDDLNCLAKTIYYEARGEPSSGKIAVGYVVVNRTKSDKYPDTICGVVKQTTQIKSKTYCQFSWYCDSDGVGKLNRIISNAAYQNCLNVAEEILLKLVDNNVPHALSFHVSRLDKHRRDITIIAKIGNHTFYRDNNSG